jgi:hypothetical protein
MKWTPVGNSTRLKAKHGGRVVGYAGQGVVRYKVVGGAALTFRLVSGRRMAEEMLATHIRKSALSGTGIGSLPSIIGHRKFAEQNNEGSSLWNCLEDGQEVNGLCIVDRADIVTAPVSHLCRRDAHELVTELTSDRREP